MKALPSTGGLSSALVRLSSVEEAAVALKALCGQAPGQLGLQASQQLQSQDILLRQQNAGAEASASPREAQARDAPCPSSMWGKLGHNSITNGMLAVRTGQADGATVLSGAGREALRSSRRPAEPAVLKGERPLHLVVNIMPGAMVMNKSRPEMINLMVYGPAFLVDIKRRLAEAGLSW